jgi:hypothetical protein
MGPNVEAAECALLRAQPSAAPTEANNVKRKRVRRRGDIQRDCEARDAS